MSISHVKHLSWPLTLCSSASGVDDAVGEVCMTVEIFSDPNTGGHKITVKGASASHTQTHTFTLQPVQTHDYTLLDFGMSWCSEMFSLHYYYYLCVCLFDWQWWQPMIFAGRPRVFSGLLWRCTSSALTSVTRRESLPPNPRTTAGRPNSMNPFSCKCWNRDSAPSE